MSKTQNQTPPPIKIHREERMNRILNRLVELADDEASGFSEEEKANFLDKLKGYDTESE